MHAMQAIATSAPADVKNNKHEDLARAKRIATKDDTMAGMLLAQEVLAYAKGEQVKWRGWAMRLWELNHEARAAFINAIKADKGAMTKAQTEHGMDKKAAQMTTRSFGTQISELSTIAMAMNAGATVAGWMAWVNAQFTDPTKHCQSEDEMLVHGGYATLVAYARTFRTGEARGRPAHGWVTKFGKFLETIKPQETDAKGNERPEYKGELLAYEQAVALYNKLNGG